MTTQNTKMDPTLCEQGHYLVCVLPVDSVSIMEDNIFEKMKHVRDQASKQGKIND